MGDTTTSNVAQAIRSSGSAVPIKTRLAIALRWLAGGSYWHISGLFGVSAGVFFHLACSLPPLHHSFTKSISSFNQGRFIVNVDHYGLRYTPSTRLYLMKSNNWEMFCSFSFVPFLPRNEVLSRPSTRKHLYLFSKDSSHLSREIFFKVNGFFCTVNAVYTTFKCQQQFGIPMFSIGTTLVPCCSWNCACTGAMHALRLAATSETVLPNPKIWRALAVHPS